MDKNTPTPNTASLLKSKGTAIDHKTVNWGDWDAPKEQPLPDAFLQVLRQKHTKKNAKYNPNIKRAKRVFDLASEGMKCRDIVVALAREGYGQAMVKLDHSAFTDYLKAQNSKPETTTTTPKIQDKKVFFLV